MVLFIAGIGLASIYGLAWMAWIGGQIWRIPLPMGGGILPMDIAAFLVAGRIGLSGPMTKRILWAREFWPWLAFLVVGIAGTVALWLTPGGIRPIDGLLHLGRLFIYSFAGLAMLGLPNPAQATRWVVGSVWAVVGLGFLQLTVMPDLRFLENYGWDPHVGRLVSTFLDPNLLAGVLLLPLSFYFLRWFREKTLPVALMALVLMAAILLTKSLAGIVAAAALVALLLLWQTRWRRSWWIVALALSALAQLSVFALPYVLPANIQDTSWKKRLQSWELGADIAKDHPVIGVGYNNLRSVKVLYPLIEPLDDNSAAGIDSSMIQAAATTGLLGLALWITFWIYLLGSLWKARTNAWAESLLVSFPALFAVSIFTNLLFFVPFVWLLFSWIGLALHSNYNRGSDDVRI